MAQRNVYRVTYQFAGRPVSEHVCAESGREASDFLGVTDGSAQATEIASSVEVVGLDARHPAIHSPEPFKAPFEIPHHVSRQEFGELQAQLADLQRQLREAKEGTLVHEAE